MSSMKTIETTPAFWYRRAMSVTLMIGGSLLLLFLGHLISPNTPFMAPITVPAVSGLLAGSAFVVSLIGLLIKNEKTAWLFSYTAFILVLGSAGYGIFSSGDLNSRFVALWMVAAIFSGLWTNPGIITTLSAGVIAGVYGVTTQKIGEAEILLFIIIFILPPITSYIALRKQKLSTDEQADAYHALASELSKVANKSEIVINAIGDGVIAIDNKGVIQLINPAAQNIMGWEKQDAMDLDYRTVFKLSDSANNQLGDDVDPIQRVLRGSPTIATNDYIITTNSGKKMNISLLVSPVGKFGNGAIIVFRDITSDISENQQRTEFVSTASHEMRTPVAAIEGYLGLALNPATAQIDDKARLYLTKAHESAQHLGRLFQDLLDVSKAEDGRLKSAPQVIDMVAITRDAVTMLTPKANEKGLSLVFKPDVSEDSANMIVPVLYVEVDPDHIQEILTNLIENGIKYTKEGMVTVDVSGSIDKVTLSIADSGIGINREDIPHLFQKFYRIDNTDTREIGGTGLGLYLCRRLAESMGGRIWVESEQGKGSIFYVELPRVSQDTAKQHEGQQSLEQPIAALPPSGV